ncbi:hypothetical protein [Streptomyces xanthophaeus]|uniref:hypothetical protein n=1 Tax=Streptomyces xanthophaeus TaxID=67385 RepID=UPI00233F64E0|nr:hypothetical protein [Streptomyces xanthophaeus]
MSRTVRWIVVVVGAVVLFGGCFWLGRIDPFGWVPDRDSDEIAAAGVFAATMTTIALGAGAAWATAGAPATPPAVPPPPAPPAPQAPGTPYTRQVAKADRKGKITQVGAGGGASEQTDQHAEADRRAEVEQRVGDPSPQPPVTPAAAPPAAVPPPAAAPPAAVPPPAAAPPAPPAAAPPAPGPAAPAPGTTAPGGTGSTP